MQAARQVKVIYESVRTQWDELVAEEGHGEARKNGLERFHCGHVLTRIVCKGSYALGILKEFDAELEVLEALLQQRRWRRGRRGRWYERRALIHMTYMEKTRPVYQTAYDGVWQALEDEDTHIGEHMLLRTARRWC